MVSASQDQYFDTSVILSTWEEVDYRGPEMLLEYKIVNITFEEAPPTEGSKSNYHRAFLNIVLKRRVEYYLTDAFLQTFLLVAVGYATCFFEVENFSDKIMVTLTTMLVTATIMGSIQSVSECLEDI